MLIHRAIAGCGLAAALSVLASPAAAITVQNHSFEDSNVANWVYGSPASWTATAYAGLLRPSVHVPSQTVFVDGVDGDQTAFSDQGDFSQTLSDTAAAGKYTLTVAVGDRSNTSLPSHTINLLAGSSVIGTATGAAKSGGTGWSDLVAMVDLMAGDPLIGETLSIQLVNNGGAQISWDNVRLDLAVIPLPAPALMLVSALGLAAVARRTRRADVRGRRGAPSIRLNPRP